MKQPHRYETEIHIRAIHKHWTRRVSAEIGLFGLLTVHTGWLKNTQNMLT